jgi:hypothetical protein
MLLLQPYQPTNCSAVAHLYVQPISQPHEEYALVLVWCLTVSAVRCQGRLG